MNSTKMMIMALNMMMTGDEDNSRIMTWLMFLYLLVSFSIALFYER